MSKSLRRSIVLIDDVWISPSRRAVDGAAVDRLIDSIREVGLLNPITVRIADNVVDPEDGQISDVTALVAGRHRLEAMRRLGADRIDCFFLDVDDIHAELAEIDENLVRANLTPAQEAAAVTRRKSIYETLHPETKATKDGGTFRGNQHGEVSDNLSFTRATADATGKDRRTIERAAARGKELGDDLKAIVGTSLDKGAELDALAKMGNDERAPLIARAKAGETVSARTVKIEADVKQRADESAAEILIEDLSHNRLEVVVSHLFTAGHKSLAITLRNKLGESVMDRRYA